MNKLLKNYIYNLLYQVFVLLVPLVTAPYLSRVLGATNLGIYGYIQSSGSMISTISLLGIYTYGNRQIAYYRDDKEKLNSNFWEISLTRVILGTFGTVIYLVYAVLGGYYSYFLLYYPFVLAAFIDCSWLYVGMEDMKPAVVKNFFSKLVCVIGIFILVKDQNDTWKYLALLSISTLFANLMVYSQLKKYIGRPSFSLKAIPRHVKSSLALFLPQVASIIYLQMDKVMLEWITGETAQISYYDQAEKIVMMPLSIITVISTVMMPRIANVHKNGDKEYIEELMTNTGIISLFLAYPLMIGISSIASKLIPWYLGSEFTPTIYAMILISPLIVSNTLIGISGNQYFTATNQIKILVKSNVAAALCNLLVNALLIPKYGYVGAAIATLLSSLVSVVIQYYYFSKFIHVSIIFKKSFKYLIYSAVMGILIQIITKVMPAKPLTTVVQIIIGIFVYATFLIISKDNYLMLIVKIGLKRTSKNM